MKKLNIALIGYGRSGWGIHGAFLRSADNDICTVVAVVEYDPARRAAAEKDFGCETFDDYRALLGRTDLDLIVSASYSDEHYAIALDLLSHGFNVLSEKPLCKTAQQAQDLIDAAKKSGAVFTVFHQYRYNDYYKKLLELLGRGLVGEVKLVKGYQNRFSRRYDWQTLLYREGGAMRNNLSHTIEQAMFLAGTDEIPQINSKLQIWNSVGDAEDYVYIDMMYGNGMRFVLECNPSDLYADGVNFEVFGTRGEMKVYANRVICKYYLPEECPLPVLDHKSLHSENGDPAYCSDAIQWHEEEFALSADAWNAFGQITSRFYHELYDHILNGGPLFVTPEHVKAEIEIMQEVERQNPLIPLFRKPQ